MYYSNSTSCRSPVNLNSVWYTTFVTRSEEKETTLQPTLENRLQIFFPCHLFSYKFYPLQKCITYIPKDCSLSLTTLKLVLMFMSSQNALL